MNNRQQLTPLFTRLKEHAARNPLQFHIPGHKKGQGMDPEFRDFMGERALSIDLINIAPLDDLHHPHGPIQEAQKLAAEAFGADHTFFSVQGTSGAIMTMVLSVCSPGDKIIVPRNVHKSVLTAIILAGGHPVFVHPVMDEQLGIAHGVTVQDVERTLRMHPDAKAVLLINPTYYGIAGNLAEIVETVHRWNIPVLVDEAHGVHTHFHERLPLSAMQAGADMAATSMHKLGGSLTQSSILNIRSQRVNPRRVQSIISMLTTTSTSYLLLASLDAARRHLATRGKEMLDRTLSLAALARERINAIPGLNCVGREIHNILCIITPGDTPETIDTLVRALTELSREYYTAGRRNRISIRLPDIPELVLSPRDAFYAKTTTVPFDESAGRIIAEFIMIYPPGIPVLLPGEQITRTKINYIREHMRVGLPVQGPEDPDIRMIRVIDE
ncbi:MAG: aminotransferase class I/II-fold pyridoxal phosphate-dependent enzyme [Planifilum fimeticola]